MTIGFRRTASFVLAFACAGFGVLACVLNPQPLPPDTFDAAAAASPSAGEDAAARDASHGEGGKAQPPDSGNPAEQAEAGSGDAPYAEPDAVADAEPDGYTSDGAADAHDDP
jgi:hypothetical protein